MTGALLAWALEAFAGDVAADALSEGPSCVLAAVDHRPYRRMVSEVRDHDPTHEDLTAFLGRVKTAWDDRDVALQGITTAGAGLSPASLRAVFGEVPHQLCTFHGIKALVQGVLQAVAAERERLAKSTPQLQRGRRSSQDTKARRLARQSKRRRQKSSEVLQQRVVFVKRRLTPSARTQLLHLTRGRPHRRTRRESMEHMDALCDRRCRTQTALDKRRKLRQWVPRFQWLGETLKKVCSSHREKALTCLDDKLLPATSNAVERGNRRHRKRQKSVYRVRRKLG